MQRRIMARVSCRSNAACACEGGLRDGEELSLEKVASHLELSRTAVSLRLHRARKALRTLLAPYFGEWGGAA
jgi:hypothetical protein